MPRTSKRTQSGDLALPARAPVGQPYGEGERALESQRRTPLPNKRASALSVVEGGGGQTQDSAAAALEQAMAMASPDESNIYQPTGRPNENVTQGLGAGSDMSKPVIQANDAYYELQALVRQYPYPDLVRLLGRIEAEM